MDKQAAEKLHAISCASYAVCVCRDNIYVSVYLKVVKFELRKGEEASRSHKLKVG